MKQLASGKHIENDCFPRTLKFEMKDLLFSFVKICVDSYISFTRFVQCRFSKLLSTYILLFKRCKYVSAQKLTFLVQNMTLKKGL
jgi:hypothetical protein